MDKVSPYHSPCNNNAVSHGVWYGIIITWAVISLKWWPEILHQIEYLVFQNYFGVFLEKKIWIFEIFWNFMNIFKSYEIF
jgi:hypothetical protein